MLVLLRDKRSHIAPIHIVSSFFFILFTCVTIDTTEQHRPPRNAVINIVLTEPANTVKTHDSENGADIIVSSRRRP